jgi:hypothetical protein
MYRFTFSFPLHWVELSDQLHFPAALTQQKEPPVPIGQEVGSARYAEVNILDPTGTRTSASRHTATAVCAVTRTKTRDLR